MYSDKDSIRQFEQAHIRDRLAEDARHVAEDGEPTVVGGHFAGEREAQRLITLIALAAVALFLAALVVAGVR